MIQIFRNQKFLTSGKTSRKSQKHKKKTNLNKEQKADYSELIRSYTHGSSKFDKIIIDSLMERISTGSLFSLNSRNKVITGERNSSDMVCSANKNERNNSLHTDMERSCCAGESSIDSHIEMQYNREPVVVQDQIKNVNENEIGKSQSYPP